VTQSIEIEILDQLSAGGMTLGVLRAVSPGDERFLQAIHGLLRAGDIELFARDGSAVPDWKWRELLEERSLPGDFDQFQAQVTDQGAAKIA